MYYTENVQENTFQFIIQSRGYGKRMREIQILSDTIKGEINRMCVTDKLSELDTMYGHAKRNIEILHKMIYDTKFKIESEEQ